ncbi:hypothetical protein L484_022644 [Morus notabilis]|uniref:Uncharacterized protein n=1 Tax=Morus notabilis TaxID=981085 RepID=W9R839_9ROSA|nr:hypothetical protein L484_022644 [Morus notabilis]
MFAEFNPRSADDIFSEFFEFLSPFEGGGTRGSSRFLSGIFGDDIFDIFGFSQVQIKKIDTNRERKIFHKKRRKKESYSSGGGRGKSGNGVVDRKAAAAASTGERGWGKSGAGFGRERDG